MRTIIPPFTLTKRDIPVSGIAVVDVSGNRK